MSFFGWIFEKTGRLLIFGARGDRGFVTLPLCPIYGVSVVLIYLLLGVPSHPSGLVGTRLSRIKKWRSFVERRQTVRLILYFFAVTLLSTAVELITGLLWQSAGAPLWDYSERAFNLFGVICLQFSLLWGVLLSSFMAFFFMPLYRLFERIPHEALTALTVWSAIPVIVDFTVNIIYLIATGERL
jgi:uncharacterized membrane protein